MHAVLLSFIFLVVTTFAVDCSWSPPSGPAQGMMFDLCPLVLANDPMYYSDDKNGGTDNYVYYWNVAANTSTPPGCSSANGYPGWQKKGDTCKYLGSLNTQLFEINNANDPEKKYGINVTYTEGEESLSNPGTKRSMTLSMKCDPTVENLSVLHITNDQESTGSERYFYLFELSSSHACPKPGLSSGGVFLIIFFVGMALYCGIGCGMNYSKGERGFPHIIPNSGFWTDLPSLCKDGVSFAASGCKSSYRTLD